MNSVAIPDTAVRSARSDLTGTVTLRPARPADLKAVYRVQEAAILGLGIAEYGRGQAEAWVRFQLSERNNVLRQGPFFVAERRKLGQIVGCGGWRGDLQRSDAAWIRSLFVHPSFIRGGIGAQLLNAVEVSARMEGRNQLYLRATVNAVPFFIASNYKNLGRRIWTVEPGVELHQVLMCKTGSGETGQAGSEHVA